MVKLAYKNIKSVEYDALTDTFSRKGRVINPRKLHGRVKIPYIYAINSKTVMHNVLKHCIIHKVDVLENKVYVRDRVYDYEDFIPVPGIKGDELYRIKSDDVKNSVVRGLLKDMELVLINARYKTEYHPTDDEYDLAWEYLFGLSLCSKKQTKKKPIINTNKGIGIEEYEDLFKSTAEEVIDSVHKSFKDIRGHKGYLVNKEGVVIDNDYNVIPPVRTVGGISYYLLRGRREFDIGKLIMLGWDDNYHVQQIDYKDLNNICYNTIFYKGKGKLHGSVK